MCAAPLCSSLSSSSVGVVHLCTQDLAPSKLVLRPLQAQSLTEATCGVPQPLGRPAQVRLKPAELPLLGQKPQHLYYQVIPELASPNTHTLLHLANWS